MNPVPEMIDAWMSIRAELHALEKAEHPDVTDRFGRVWTWWKGDLYGHCSMAWTQDMITAESIGLPTIHYTGMCDICCAGHEHTSEEPS